MVCSCSRAYMRGENGKESDSFLVLVFGTTRSQMALRSVLLIRMGKQNVEIKYI